MQVDPDFWESDFEFVMPWEEDFWERGGPSFLGLCAVILVSALLVAYFVYFFVKMCKARQKRLRKEKRKREKRRRRKKKRHQHVNEVEEESGDQGESEDENKSDDKRKTEDDFKECEV